MSKKTLSAVRAIVRQMLRDEFSPDIDLTWEDDELDLHIGHCLQEISKSSPYEKKETLTTTANSKELDISSIENLLEIKKAEYPTGNTPRSYRNVIEIDAETIEVDISTLFATTGGAGTLTGTVTFTSGSAIVSGSDTAFSTELEAGYHIKKSTGTRWYRIYSVDSDTQLTLAEPSRDSGADASGATQYCYETVYLYCAKLHSLTESSSTLNPLQELLLVDGVCAYAAISKSKDYIDKVNIGGARTAADMLTWGQNKLAIYKAELRHLAKPRTRREYPKE